MVSENSPKLIFAHGRDFGRGWFYVVEPILRRARDVAGTDSDLYLARPAPGFGTYESGCRTSQGMFGVSP